MKKVKMPPKPYEDLCRGHLVYVNTGELSFETRPHEAGTFPATFLEWIQNEHWIEEQKRINRLELDEENTNTPWYAKVVNKLGKVEVINPALMSIHNI